MKNIVQGVKGAREFYPAQMRNRNFLLNHIREVSQQFGYEEYDGPFLEKIDLYAAKSGEELVKEQAFVFPDRGGELITLRPELTPSLARMVAEKQNELIYPLRWWSFGPFWRYEKPQKGRTREFFQWNIDLIGLDSAYADAELICICATFLKNIGLKPNQARIFVNHRQLMDDEILGIGILDDKKKKIFKLIDRIDKVQPEAWDALVLEEGITKNQLVDLKKVINNYELWKNSEDLLKVFEMVKSMGLEEYVQYNPRIIRGLDYYTGIVFEAWDPSGDGRAILGGGHYNNLVGDVGGEPLPGVGFAMGDVMISFLLEKYELFKNEKNTEIDVLVATFDESSVTKSFKIMKDLHENHIRAVTYPHLTKLQKQFKFADRMGIKIVVIIGTTELEEGTVTIKNLAVSSQVTVLQSQLIETIRSMIAQQ